MAWSLVLRLFKRVLLIKIGLIDFWRERLFGLGEVFWSRGTFLLFKIKLFIFEDCDSPSKDQGTHPDNDFLRSDAAFLSRSRGSFLFFRPLFQDQLLTKITILSINTSFLGLRSTFGRDFYFHGRLFTFLIAANEIWLILMI